MKNLVTPLLSFVARGFHSFCDIKNKYLLRFFYTKILSLFKSSRFDKKLHNIDFLVDFAKLELMFYIALGNKMFKPRTDKIHKIATKFPQRIKELDGIFDKSTAIYIDFANIIPRQDKLKRKIDIKRLKQFLDSFTNIKKITFYYGTLEGDLQSEELIQTVKNLCYQLVTKPVKIMKKSIDISSIEKSNPSILNNFIRKSLLNEMSIANIEYFNEILEGLNNKGVFFIEDRKCNFDVEMGIDMLLDLRDGQIEKFIIRSGDSDFNTAVDQISKVNKQVYVFSVPGRVSSELNNSQAKIYDIKKIRNFICRNRNIQPGILE